VGAFFQTGVLGDRARAHEDPHPLEALAHLHAAPISASSTE
jgi:hypothetical protein